MESPFVAERSLATMLNVFKKLHSIRIVTEFSYPEIGAARDGDARMCRATAWSDVQPR
jgi:hypothetical protein